MSCARSNDLRLRILDRIASSTLRRLRTTIYVHCHRFGCDCQMTKQIRYTSSS